MPRKRPSTRSSVQDKLKGLGGRYEKQCGCIQHEEFTKGRHYQVVRVTNNKRRSSYKSLVEKNLLSSRASYVCSLCLEHSSKHLCKQNVRMPSHLKQAGGSEEEKTYSFSFSEETADSELLATDNNTFEHDTDSSDDHSDDDTSMDEADDNNVEDQQEQHEEAQQHYPVLDNILQYLKQIPGSWHNFTDSDKDKLTEIGMLLGKIIQLDLYHDSKQVTLDSHNITEPVDKLQWLNNRNPMLLGFVTGCTKTSLPTMKEKKITAVVHVVEQILKARHLCTVAPFALQRNIVQYAVTGSKLATNLLGTWEPAGAYTTVQSHINAPAEPPNIPNGDVHIAIDNEQRIGRSSGRLREGSSLRIDICTTMSCLQTAEKTSLQNVNELKPGSWRKRTKEDLTEVMAEVNRSEEKALEDFRQYRNDFIETIIESVETELDEVNNDYVDLALRHRDTYCVCCKCKFVSTNIGQCPNCKHDPDRERVDHDVYYRTPSKHPDNPPKMTIAEPCMVNPNSRVNINTVLEHVREHANILPTERQWTYVWCDAVPYLIGSKLQEELFKCALCGAQVEVNEIDTHQESHTDEEAEFELWFSEIFLRPGPGHIELNMARALMKLLWHPYLQHFAVLLGFKSSRAQDVIHNGVDHHRSRNIISVLLNALSKELVRPFAIQCRLANPDECNADTFIKWVVTNVRNPNYMFGWTTCFTYLLSFQLYTESVRKNHHDNMMAARAAFAPIFYGRNHPRYRELHIRDMLDRVQAPPDLKENISSHESFSLSGQTNKGQGVDFLHEEVNRTVKSLLPPGAVTEDIWKRVCRKADALEEIKRSCISSAGMNAKSGKKAPKRHDHVETMMRREFRSSHLFETPLEERSMKNIVGDENKLDYDLYNIGIILKESYKEYKEALLKSGKFGKIKISQALFVTKEERERGEDIKRKTKQEIKEEITKMTCMYGVTAFDNEIGKLKQNTAKEEYLKLYYDILEAIEEENSRRITEEGEEELEGEEDACLI